MRSRGQVRFITLTSRVQMAAVGAVAALLLAWIISISVMAFNQYRAQHDIVALAERETEVATAEKSVATYRDDLHNLADDLERRQVFLEEMVDMLPDDLRKEAAQTPAATATPASDQTLLETANKVSAAIPEAASFAQLDRRQIAFVDHLTRIVDQRNRQAEAAMRALGLNPKIMAAATRSAKGRMAQGGPLESLSTSSDGSVDPRFERLGLGLARLAIYEQALAGIPQVMPVTNVSISSGFGYRHDPFTRGGAMHKGIDFRGAIGTPIHAAARGVVSFVGRRSGYGKVVEINHGNGLMTRYAHMSAWKAKAGQKVKAGDIIGAMGSTGRSTGSHLHFEVRINNRAVNPRPFLESAPHVLEEIRTKQPTASHIAE
ncbi:peptidoglycan DD-metalloendopeptidase family protein [Altererythrobacter indicus]|uniref:Peptidoglycan DD-metalloendopeptidase family protein n=2 Tax=Altericroceibacterium indicum TaxID=374177 RepID=A0A845A817_9SPHN|nr:peptidoglycan DD-metalloendopeptidase family protein [Altericroceibacterium indicum]